MSWDFVCFLSLLLLLGMAPEEAAVGAVELSWLVVACEPAAVHFFRSPPAREYLPNLFGLLGGFLLGLAGVGSNSVDAGSLSAAAERGSVTYKQYN